MTISILVGPSYCGKSYICKELFEKKSDCQTIHVGDLCRAEGKPLDYQFSIDELADVINKVEIKKDHIVIDNLFRTSEGINIIDKLKNIKINSDNTVVYIIRDKRSNVDYTARGRVDDEFIHMKRKIWFDNEKMIIAEVLKRKIGVCYLDNTDDGIKVGGIDYNGEIVQ